MIATGSRVRIIESANELLADKDIGRLGRVIGCDHPAAGLAGSLTVVLDPQHNGLGELQSRVLRFLNPSQVEPA